MDFLAWAVLAVIDSARVAKAIFVGHSNGVPVIRQVLRRAPQRVVALIAVDGALRNVLRPEMTQWMRSMATSPRFAEVYPAMVEQGPTGNLAPDDIARVKRGALATPAHVFVGGLDALEEPAIWNEDPVTVPLLVVHAAASQWSADYEAAVRRLAPHVEYHVWNDASHFLMMEKARPFNDLLRDFVRRVSRPAGS